MTFGVAIGPAVAPAAEPQTTVTISQTPTVDEAPCRITCACEARRCKIRRVPASYASRTAVAADSPGSVDTTPNLNDTIMLRDLVVAVRTLLHAPSFTLTALLTIALGIGVTTGVFSVVNAVLLRPLPYSDAQRLTLVWSDMRARGVTDFPIPPGDFHDLRERATLFEQFGAVVTLRGTIRGEEGEPERVRVARTTANLLAMLGARVIAGRNFVPSDDTPVAAPPDGAGTDTATPPASIILSHAFWQRRFGGEEVIGRVLDVDGPAVIVGVLAPGVELLFPPGSDIERTPDVWSTLRVDFANGSRVTAFLRVIGKLKQDVSVAAAQSQLDGIAADLRERFPINRTADVRLRAEPMHADLVADVRPTILTLMGAVVFVLLIACANVANLLLVRSARQERDLAVRAALGATRRRLMTRLFAESLVLAVTGAALGTLIAHAGIRLMLRLQPAGLPRIDEITIDLTVLGFTALAALAAALVFGLLPAWRASHADVGIVLRKGGRTGALARGSLFRNGIVVAEVALAFVLLIGSGLMLRSLAALQRVDPGFDADGLLTFFVNARGNEGQRSGFYDQVEARLAALPRVATVAAAAPLPLDGRVFSARWGTEDAAAEPARFQQANVHIVRPGYFEKMAARVIDGRTFTSTDNNAAAMHVVIDDVLARKAFGDGRAVGRRLLVRVRAEEPENYLVVGVVAHHRHVSLSGDRKEGLFLTDGHLGQGIANRWVVRTSGGSDYTERRRPHDRAGFRSPRRGRGNRAHAVARPARNGTDPLRVRAHCMVHRKCCRSGRHRSLRCAFGGGTSVYR